MGGVPPQGRGHSFSQGDHITELTCVQLGCRILLRFSHFNPSAQTFFLMYLIEVLSKSHVRLSCLDCSVIMGSKNTLMLPQELS